MPYLLNNFHNNSAPSYSLAVLYEEGLIACRRHIYRIRQRKKQGNSRVKGPFGLFWICGLRPPVNTSRYPMERDSRLGKNAKFLEEEQMDTVKKDSRSSNEDEILKTQQERRQPRQISGQDCLGSAVRAAVFTKRISRDMAYIRRSNHILRRNRYLYSLWPVNILPVTLTM